MKIQVSRQERGVREWENVSTPDKWMEVAVRAKKKVLQVSSALQDRSHVSISGLIMIKK